MTRSGFFKMIAEAIVSEDDFEDVVAKFGGHVGLEGRALISVRIADRNAEDGEDAV